MKIMKILPVFLIISLLNGCSNSLVNVPALNQEISQGNLSDNPKNLLVKLKPGISESKVINLVSGSGLNSFEMVSGDLRIGEIKIKGSSDKETIKNKFLNSGFFEYVEEDKALNFAPGEIKNISQKNSFSVKSDSQEEYKWSIKSINAEKPLDNPSANTITVAVIDSGIDPNHPDLKNVALPMIDLWNKEAGDDKINSNGVETDFKGRDGNGHGTHVAGIINSVIKSMNSVNIKILPIKAANNTGSTSAALLTKAILIAVDQGARVINLSIGGPSSEGTKALQDTISFAYKKGVVIVASAGNDSVRRRNFVGQVTIPSAYPEVISVAAINKHDEVADYSNGGPEIDISAPGGEDMANDDTEKIYSTWPTYQTYLGTQYGISGPYASLAGTSMASPYVSATAALLLAKNDRLSSAQVRLRLLSTADDIDAKGFDTASGFGKLNVFKALSDDSDDLR
jgi:subtilisin family serine protease